MGTRIVAPCWAMVALCASAAGCALTVTGIDQERETAPAVQAAPRCAAASFTLARRDAEVLFVVDRSGSMSTAIATDATGATSRWDALRGALADALPRYQTALTAGLALFPSGAASCDVRDDGLVEVAPARGSAADVLRALSRTAPGGSTPTGAAVLAGARYLLRRASANVSRTIVLATDGAPTCTAGGGDNGVTDAVNAIATARAMGVSTYVIGISMPGEAELMNALDRMAVAGGHPLPGSVRHYAIHDPGALARAFMDVPRSISECTWFASTAAPAEGEVTLRAGGAVVPHDPARRDGWAWSDPARGQVTLYGPACARLSGHTLALEGAVTCTAR